MRDRMYSFSLEERGQRGSQEWAAMVVDFGSQDVPDPYPSLGELTVGRSRPVVWLPALARCWDVCGLLFFPRQL